VRAAAGLSRMPGAPMEARSSPSLFASQALTDFMTGSGPDPATGYPGRRAAGLQEADLLMLGFPH
jgi:hypothetical protein